MFAIIVTEKGGEQRRLEFDKSEVTIGRVQGNDVILPKGNVSKRHARIVLKDGKFIIVDLKSTNGTYVNGRKITSPLVVKDTDKIYVGDFILGVDDSAGAAAQPPSSGGPGAFPPPRPQEVPPSPPSSSAGINNPPPAPGPPPSSQGGIPPIRPQPPANAAGPAPFPADPPPRAPNPSGNLAPGPAASQPRARVPAPSSDGLGGNATPGRPSAVPEVQRESRPPLDVHPAPQPRSTAAAPAVRPIPNELGRGVPVAPLEEAVVKRLEVQSRLVDQLIERLELASMPPERLRDEDTWQRAESSLVDLVESFESSGELASDVDQNALLKETLNEAVGLGPLEEFVSDDAISEIIVDRRDRILIRRDGTLAGAGKAFSSDTSLRRIVERLVAPTGRTIDTSSPLADLRLSDGSRLTAAVPPVAVRGACLTLRKPSSRAYEVAGLIGDGTLSEQMGAFLTTCVSARRNILVCGASGSGKGTVLAALAAASPKGERIVSVEEVAELSLGREEWIALEARPGDGNGVAPVALATILRSALHMRADRLVVGEVSGSEAYELLSAMASSTDGALISMTGDVSQTALSRLAALARLGAPGTVTSEALYYLTAHAVDVIVRVARYADGVVRIAGIDEVVGVKEDGVETRELFAFRGASGEGVFAASGAMPSFYNELQARGIDVDTSIFQR